MKKKIEGWRIYRERWRLNDAEVEAFWREIVEKIPERKPKVALEHGIDKVEGITVNFENENTTEVTKLDRIITDGAITDSLITERNSRSNITLYDKKFAARENRMVDPENIEGGGGGQTDRFCFKTIQNFSKTMEA